ncbi:MAG: hemolysin family protein [Candidatus Heimdallarchaeota archaeon]|nr:hemolysin family protein [Candidatus Heimdallarchaeota archaeon]
MVELESVDFLDFILIIFLIILNGFFVASEFAFVRVRRTRVEELISNGSKGAKRALDIINDLDRSMSSTQLGITLASIALGFVGEPFFTSVLISLIFGVSDVFNLNFEITPTNLPYIEGTAFLVAYFIVAYLHVVIGELAPKSVAIQHVEKTVLVCAEPLYWFMKLTSPLLRFFVWSSNSILKSLKIPVQDEVHGTVYSEDELKMIIENSIGKGEIEEYESKLIFNILEFTDTSVKKILTPRIDIKALPVTTNLKAILELSVATGYSRIPIYETDLDDVKGFIHIKDVVRYINGKDTNLVKIDIPKILRPVITVHEGKPLDDLLKEMQEQKTQVAIIIDEYGSFEGMVTIEDIIEAIFGPIRDEFDTESIKNTIMINNENIIVGGQVSIEEFNKAISDGNESEINSEKSVTLAGYVLELFKSEIPTIGDIVKDDLFNYKIVKLDGHRIESIEITKK